MCEGISRQVKKKYLSSPLKVYVFTLHESSSYKPINVLDITSQNRINPDSIETPLLSWKTITKMGEILQKAYKIRITSSKQLFENGNPEILYCCC